MSKIKETRFTESLERLHELDKDSKKDVQKPRNESSSSKRSEGDRKSSLHLMTDDATKWIKHTINTKIEVNGKVEEVPTEAFGVIDFKGSSRKAKAKFVQLSDTTPVEDVFELLTRYWKLPKPRILISITGGAKIFSLTDDMKDYLIEGLRKISFESTGAWIITGGTNTGIMKLVGENLHGICRSLIGIASWGVITNADTLLGDEQNIPLGGTFPYEVESSITEQKTFLDHNHPNFLLVDDSSVGKYGVEIKLCSQLIKYVAQRKEPPRVPSVMILINGGVFSIENVLNAVTENELNDEPAIPVLVIKRSGRAANVLAYALENKDGLDVRDYHELKILIEKEMNLQKQSDKEKVFKGVLECLEKANMIKVVDPEDEEGIDEKILKTILSCYNLTRDLKLWCTVLWNRLDVAHNLILQEFSYWQKPELANAMTLALALNRFTFVEYFVEQNIPLHKMLTKPYLEVLYGHRSTRRRSAVIQKSVKRCDSKIIHKENFDLLKLAISYYKEADTLIISYDKIFEFIQILCEDMTLVGTENFVTPPDDLEDGEYSVHAYRDILLWAVLNNMQDMAKVLWKLGDEQIAKAIVAAHINNKLASRASHENLPVDIVNMFKSNAKEFESLALKVLDACYSENTDQTKRMLTMELGEFKSHNCLSLAHASFFEQFIAHTAVQTILQELWIGERTFTNNLIQSLSKKMEEYKNYQNDINYSTSHRKSTFFTSFSEGDPKSIANSTIDENVERMMNYFNMNYFSEESQRNIPSNPNERENQLYQSRPTQSHVSSIKEKHSKRISRFNKAIGNFYKSLVSYIIFLILLSYVAILVKNTTEPGIAEIIVCIWVLSIAAEEIYQFNVLPAVKWKNKFKEYRSSIFNVIDFCGIVLFLTGFVMQFFEPLLQYGHLLYAIDAAIWIMRLLQYFYANKILGPYILMIGRMFIDMLYFISILGVFLMAHGVLTSAILMPETKIHNMLVNVIHHPYFAIFGELFTDDDAVDDPNKTDFGTTKFNSYSGPLAWIFLGIFLLIANVLLLNLLIAIFGNTFERVQEKSDEIWKYYRYDLITEFSLQLPLPPPFTIFALIWKISPLIGKKLPFACTKNKTEETSKEKMVHLDIQRENIGQFQIKNVADVLRQQKMGLKEHYENKRFEELSEMMLEVKNEISIIKKTMRPNQR